MNQFPPSPDYSIKTVSNFFENSRRYSQLNVKKSSIRKILIILFCHLWVVEETYINFCLQVHFQVSADWYCSHYLPPVSRIPVANLPLVSLIPVAICHRWQIICRRYRWQRWQICHRCQQLKGNWWQNLPPVSLTPVVRLDLRISPQIFEKIWNDPNVIIRGLGKGDLWKKLEAKNLMTLSL